jgi:hypothetical protein
MLSPVLRPRGDGAYQLSMDAWANTLAPARVGLLGIGMVTVLVQPKGPKKYADMVTSMDVNR